VPNGKREKSRSDAQQNGEKEVLEAFAEEEGFSWGEIADVPALAGLGIELDGVAVLEDGTVLIAEDQKE